MTMFRLSGLRALSLLLVGASLLGISGCNPTGNGAGPVRLSINSPNGVANADTGKAYVCLRSGITASLFFDNGTVADFTARGVNWTSSNPSVLKVTNTNTDLIPGTTAYYGPGVLLPVAPGTARISASFSSFSDYIDITVGPQPTFTIFQKNPQTSIGAPLPVDANDASKQYVRIAPNSIIDLDVRGTLDGLPLDVSAAAVWSFDAPVPPSTSNDSTAVIDAGFGLITAVAAASPMPTPMPLTARATFPTCGQSVAATVVVAPLTGLSISRQFGTDPLIVGNSEAFTAMGDFGDGPEQDLSIQAVFTSSTPATAAFIGGALASGNLLSAIVAGTVTVSAVFNTGTVAVPVNYTTPTLTVTTQTDTLNGIAIAPTAVTLLAGASTIVPLTVTGTYASGLTQQINRRTAFSSDNTTIVQVSNSTQTAGEIASGGLLVNALPAGTTTATITAAVPNPANAAVPFTATVAVTAADPVAPPPP